MNPKDPCPFDMDAQFLLGVLNGMSEMVRVTDGKSNVLMENSAYSSWRGDKAPDKCFEAIGLGYPCTECISLRAIEEDRRLFKEITIGRRVYAIESCPIRDRTGKNVAAMEEIKDITEYRQMYSELMDRNKKMENDLEMARSLQHALLPKEISFGEYSFYSIFRPCERLGGDVFDIIDLTPSRKAFYIADVSGHGVTAAMMTMLLYETVRFIAQRNLKHSASEDILAMMQKSFNPPTFGDDKYITVILGVLDTESGKVELANAGHTMLPVYISPKGATWEIEISGMPLSNWAAAAKYKGSRLVMEKGGKLLLYTDGFAGGGREGYKGIQPILKGVKGDKIIRALVRHATSIKIEDDITLLMLQRG
ncbi:MAG: SpoIIE family protein phosphatase [Bacillota bacterium]|nr:SpoIIE family protein phosphatase [Bacillota bacterium]